jgi:hypothetical protein
MLYNSVTAVCRPSEYESISPVTTRCVTCCAAASVMSQDASSTQVWVAALTSCLHSLQGNHQQYSCSHAVWISRGSSTSESGRPQSGLLHCCEDICSQTLHAHTNVPKACVCHMPSRFRAQHAADLQSCATAVPSSLLACLKP